MYIYIYIYIYITLQAGGRKGQLLLGLGVGTGSPEGTEGASPYVSETHRARAKRQDEEGQG